MKIFLRSVYSFLIQRFLKKFLPVFLKKNPLFTPERKSLLLWDCLKWLYAATLLMHEAKIFP